MRTLRRNRVGAMFALLLVGLTIPPPAHAGFKKLVKKLAREANPATQVQRAARVGRLADPRKQVAIAKEEVKRNVVQTKQLIGAARELPRSPKQAGRQVLGAVVDRAIGDTRVPEAMRAYVDNIVRSQAQPLPADVQAALRELVRKGGYPFSMRDISAARYIHKDRLSAKPIFPGTLGQDNPAITYGDLIIVNDEFLSFAGTLRVAKWAHELTHVSQYRQRGWNAFLSQYAREARKGHDEISLEREGLDVEYRVEREAAPQLFYSGQRR